MQVHMQQTAANALRVTHYDDLSITAPTGRPAEIGVCATGRLHAGTGM
jgi:hypothetical protein